MSGVFLGPVIRYLFVYMIAQSLTIPAQSLFFTAQFASQNPAQFSFFPRTLSEGLVKSMYLYFGTCRQVICQMCFVWISVLKILVEKMISPVIFGTDHAFKWQNTLFLTNKLFIKVSMMRRSRLVLFLQGKFLCFGTRRQVACEVFIVWRSSLKNDISGFIWHKSFIQTIKCSSFNQRIGYGMLLSLNCFFKEKFVFYIQALASRLQDVYRLKCSEDLNEKMISPLIFDTNCSFKRQNALLLTKGSFIKVSMARCSC